MRLTSNQKETLHAIVIGQCGGMLRKPLPSLVKLGLLELKEPPETSIFRPVRGSMFSLEPTPQTHLLTPLGLEVYKKLREASFQSDMKRLYEARQQDLNAAEGKTSRGNR